ncbi:hypothetical protein [Streptomyces cellulosae]|uniref:hypothetical protein n=1 Tax=Streptomyces cellulosae TaxID=1968 RepID=UPI0005603307|nr:hypothetical protein [Streptomyces cellulosae]
MNPRTTLLDTLRTTPLLDPRRTLPVMAELLAWWAALAVLWLVFISTVDPLELAVGAGAAAVGALAARAARRAVTGR